MTHKTKTTSEGEFIKALILDLDGVITQTRKTHKKAWKEMFDNFFEQFYPGQASMTESDYQEYIDGKPCYQGVKSFLASRGIELPYGSKNDEPGYDTVSALGIPIFPDNDEIFNILAQKKPVIFLDYDGTLSPIVPRPEDAIISPEMKETLKELAEIFTVAIVTGRDKEDVENLVGLDELIYAGSHGYIISGPNGLFMEHPDSEKIIPRLDAIEKEVTSCLEDKTEGTQMDRKRYAIGIHYRNARPEDEKVVLELVDEILKKHPGHKKGEGKKIIEIKPDLDWHKGKAVLWILDALNLSENKDVVPVFIGDDITDEDGFEALKEMGLGILVGGHGQPTAAKYALKNVFQVREFLKKLIELHAQKP